MSVVEVDALLGRPVSINQRAEGTLKVSASVYETSSERVEAVFVEGVLVRFVVNDGAANSKSSQNSNSRGRPGIGKRRSECVDRFVNRGRRIKRSR